MSTNHRPYSDTAAEGKEEFAFRFPIGEASDLNPREMLGDHLRELLDLLTLTCQGREVKVDGFSPLNAPHTGQHLYRSEEPEREEPGHPLDVYEPRIKYIRRIIESLSSIIDFEYQGRRVPVDGFRLKKPEQWLSPGGGAVEVLAHAATRCNLRCRFCYNDGSPSAFRPRARLPEEEYHEILTRIDYYVPGSGLNIFPNLGGPCESLAHPRILDILAALRRKTGEPLRIPTNGSMLTPAMIENLAGHQPVFLDLSLNSASPERRRWLMDDPEPRVAIEAPARLRAAGIPYSVVIVPWPFPSVHAMLDDLKETIAFSAGRDTAFIQISLPGYSRFFSKKPLFNREKVWNGIRDAVQELRSVTECPLILRPGLFEEYLEPEAVNVPCVIGAVKNSPLARAGVRMGDRIVKVGGLPVKSRPQARSLLALLHGSDPVRSSITIMRNGERLDLGLDHTDFDYPYDPLTTGHMGAVFASSGVPRDWIERLHLVISRHGAREALVLTSRLVRPVLERMIREQPFPPGIRLHFRVPDNRYLGGNIFMGDLLVVEDFIAAVREFLAEGGVRPDLILIPSSPFHLSGWGRDLTGRVYKEVERASGIPAALVECDPLFD